MFGNNWCNKLSRIVPFQRSNSFAELKKHWYAIDKFWSILCWLKMLSITSEISVVSTNGLVKSEYYKIGSEHNRSHFYEETGFDLLANFKISHFFVTTI